MTQAERDEKQMREASPVALTSTRELIKEITRRIELAHEAGLDYIPWIHDYGDG